MSEATVRLTAAQIEQFHGLGFLQLPQVSTPQELQMLGRTFDHLFAQRAGRNEGNHYDLVGSDIDGERETLPSIINPVNYAPELRDLVFRRNAHAIARQLLGPKVTPAFEHAILKTAMEGPPTPWHQDEAYRVDSNFAYKQISFWMPLGDATVENGCMHYIPKSNLGPVLPHRSYKNDPRIHAIECTGEFEPADACACPVPAGGTIVHDGRTLHYTGPNRTKTARCAYILAFEIPPRPLSQPRDFYWNREKQTPNQMRRSSWRRHGGIAIEAVRKYRLGMLHSPGRILFELRRAARAAWRFLKPGR
jgi:hypothetical protein